MMTDKLQHVLLLELKKTLLKYNLVKDTYILNRTLLVVRSNNLFVTRSYVFVQFFGDGNGW